MKVPFHAGQQGIGDYNASFLFFPVGWLPGSVSETLPVAAVVFCWVTYQPLVPPRTCSASAEWRSAELIDPFVVQRTVVARQFRPASNVS